MENDELALIEESLGSHPGDIPQDDHDEEGTQLSDADMEKLFDEAEQEEKNNRKNNDKKTSSDEADKKS